jgi:hypothetical protein
MALLCPKCGQHEVLVGQPTCPGGCDLTDLWAQVASAAPEERSKTPPVVVDETPVQPVTGLQEPPAAPPAPEPAAAVAIPEAVPAALPAEAAIPAAVPVAEVVCPGCQTILHPEARFCDVCGWPVVPHCPECGTENRTGARFCRGCGARLSGARPERRGRTRFCPTCGHPMGMAPGRRTEAMPPRTPQPRLPEVEQTIPAAEPPPPAAEPPPLAAEQPAAAAESPVPTTTPEPPGEPPVVETVPVEQVSVPEEAPAEPALPEEAPPVREYELVIVRRDGSAVASFPLKEGDNLVGVRTPTVIPTVDLSPYDPRKVISRRHAIVRVAGGRVLLGDLGSTNGTTVNGAALVKKAVEVNEESDIAFAGLRCRLRAK